MSGPPHCLIGASYAGVRKGREEALKELRKAIHFSEERSWIFVPNLNLWIYDTVGTQGANHALRNRFLMDALLRSWKIERYHIHPWAAWLQAWEEDDFYERIARQNQVSDEILALLYLGRPSTDDLMTALDLDVDSTSYIIHPWGLTRYSVKRGKILYGDGRVETIYPPLLGWTGEDLKFARQWNSPQSNRHWQK